MFLKNPFYHTLVLLGLAVIAMIGNRLWFAAGNEWIIGAFAILAFEIINPAIGIFSKNWWKYLGISLLCFVGLFFLSLIFSSLISAWSLDELRESAMVYLVIIYYPVTILIAGVIRVIIWFTKKKS